MATKIKIYYPSGTRSSVIRISPTGLTLFIYLLFVLFSCRSDGGGLEKGAMYPDYFKDYERPSNRWGCINRNGSIVIPAIYDAIYDFSCERAIANKKGLWGIIDTSGNVILDFQYMEARSFQENRCFIRDFTGQWFISDSDGEILDSLNYSGFRHFNNGLCPVEFNGAWGLISLDGSVHTAPMFQDIIPLDTNLCIVKMRNAFGLLRLPSDTLLGFNYSSIIDGGHDKLILRKSGNCTYYIPSLKSRGERKYTECYAFENGYALAKDSSSYLLMNHSFDIIKRYNYPEMRPVGNGRYAFKNALGKWGIMDLEGRILYPARLEYTHRYSEKKLVARAELGYIYIDTEGQFISPIAFPLAWDFREGMARVITDAGMAYIDVDGQIFLEGQFRDIRDFHNGRARFQTF